MRLGRLYMPLSDLNPRLTLVTQMKPIIKWRFPLMDAHNHLAEPAKSSTGHECRSRKDRRCGQGILLGHCGPIRPADYHHAKKNLIGKKLIVLSLCRSRKWQSARDFDTVNK